MKRGERWWKIIVEEGEREMEMKDGLEGDRRESECVPQTLDLNIWFVTLSLSDRRREKHG